MPFYEYQCTECGHRLEALQKMSAPALTQCPQCQTESLKKLISAAAFRLKGSGWYETDFKHNDKPPADKPTDKAADGPADQSAAKAADQSADQSAAKATKQAADKSADSAAAPPSAAKSAAKDAAARGAPRHKTRKTESRAADT